MCETFRVCLGDPPPLCITPYNPHALKFTPGIAEATLPPRGVASFHYAFLTIVVTLRATVVRPRAQSGVESASETGNFNELLQRFGVAGTIGTLPRARAPCTCTRFQVPERVPEGYERDALSLWILRGSTCQALTCPNY